MWWKNGWSVMKSTMIYKQYVLVLKIVTPLGDKRILIKESTDKQKIKEEQHKENEKIKATGNYITVCCEVDEYIYKGDDYFMSLVLTNRNV